MRFDPTVSFGTILTIVSIVTSTVGILIAFSAKWAEMKTTLDNHAQRLTEYDTELKDQRRAHTALIGQVQHLVGQMEILLQRRMRESDR